MNTIKIFRVQREKQREKQGIFYFDFFISYLMIIAKMSDTVDSLRQLIIAGMESEPHHLEIIDESGGCGAKFKIIVVSNSFEGVVSFA